MKRIALVHWTLVLLFLVLLWFAGGGIRAAAAVDKDVEAPAPLDASGASASVN